MDDYQTLCGQLITTVIVFRFGFSFCFNLYPFDFIQSIYYLFIFGVVTVCVCRISRRYHFVRLLIPLCIAYFTTSVPSRQSSDRRSILIKENIFLFFSQGASSPPQLICLFCGYTQVFLTILIMMYIYKSMLCHRLFILSFILLFLLILLPVIV